MCNVIEHEELMENNNLLNSQINKLKLEITDLNSKIDDLLKLLKENNIKQNLDNIYDKNVSKKPAIPNINLYLKDKISQKLKDSNKIKTRNIPISTPISKRDSVNMDSNMDAIQYDKTDS